MALAAVSTAYIQNLPHAQDRDLRPVAGDQFVRGLMATYGDEKVLPAMNYLMFKMPNTHSGTEAFKKRFEASVGNGTDLSVADQKYIADMTKRIALGQFKI